MCVLYRVELSSLHRTCGARGVCTVRYIQSRYGAPYTVSESTPPIITLPLGSALLCRVQRGLSLRTGDGDNQLTRGEYSKSGERVRLIHSQFTPITHCTLDIAVYRYLCTGKAVTGIHTVYRQ